MVPVHHSKGPSSCVLLLVAFPVHAHVVPVSSCGCSQTTQRATGTQRAISDVRRRSRSFEGPLCGHPPSIPTGPNDCQRCADLVEEHTALVPIEPARRRACGKKTPAWYTSTRAIRCGRSWDRETMFATIVADSPGTRVSGVDGANGPSPAGVSLG